MPVAAVQTKKIRLQTMQRRSVLSHSSPDMTHRRNIATRPMWEASGKRDALYWDKDGERIPPPTSQGKLAHRWANVKRQSEVVMVDIQPYDFDGGVPVFRILYDAPLGDEFLSERGHPLKVRGQYMRESELNFLDADSQRHWDRLLNLSKPACRVLFTAPDNEGRVGRIISSEMDQPSVYDDLRVSRHRSLPRPSRPNCDRDMEARKRARSPPRLKREDMRSEVNQPMVNGRGRSRSPDGEDSCWRRSRTPTPPQKRRKFPDRSERGNTPGGVLDLDTRIRLIKEHAEEEERLIKGRVLSGL